MTNRFNLPIPPLHYTIDPLEHLRTCLTGVVDSLCRHSLPLVNKHPAVGAAYAQVHMMSTMKLPPKRPVVNPQVQALRDFLYEPDGEADLSKFKFGAGQQKERNQLFASVRAEITWFLSPGVGIGKKEEKSKRAVELIAAVIDGVSHAYPETMKHSAQLDFLSNGFTERSIVLKNLILRAPEFEHFRADLFSIDLGL